MGAHHSTISMEYVAYLRIGRGHMEVLRQEALQGFPIVGEYTISNIATMRG